MSNDSKENTGEEVIGKLDKVADSLEIASTQLSNVVTQQQLDLIRERISGAENELSAVKTGFENLAMRTAAHADEAESGIEALAEEQSALERDFAGMRALVITSFVVATISLLGLIIVSIQCKK